MPVVNTTLYGDIARFAGGKHIATLDLTLPKGAVMDTLLDELALPAEDRGYLFVNAVLYDVPGLYASKNEPLHDGDHVGIFSTRHMYPYQYRDGIRMSASLQKAMQSTGTMHNTYHDLD
jgi:hypothetical protein